MTQPQDSPQVFDGIDIEVDPDDVETPDAEDQPATSDAERFREDGDTQGGTGGLDSGGAG